jgi:hypothetical protein
MLDRPEFHRLHSDVESTLAMMDAPTGVTPNIAQIEQLRDAVSQDIIEMRNRYQSLQEQLEDFDSFVEDLPTSSLVADTSYDQRVYAASLFSIDDDLRAIIKGQPDLTTSHIDMQR